MALPQAGVELVAKGLAGFVGDVTKSQAAVKGLGDTSTGAARSVDAFVASMQRTNKIASLTNTLGEQRAALKILEQELAATSAKYGEGSIQAQKKQLALQKLTNAIGQTEAKLKTE